MSKKISFLVGSMRRGGAERVISILANDYAARDWDVSILTLLDESNDYILDDAVKFTPICGNSKSQLMRIPYWIKAIRRHVKVDKPDCLVSFVTRINLVALVACIGMNKRILVSERSDPSAPGRVPPHIKMLTELLYPRASLIVFQTNWAKSYFSRKIQEKGVVLANPIQVATLARPTASKKVVAVGRLLEVKNHTFLIRTFKKFVEKHPDYKLYIYGEGKLLEDLKNLIEDLALNENVFLPGNVLDVHERIADAEMFVLTSNFEGFSNALFEAMMMGLPCISTKVAGANDMIENGVNGLLIDKGNEDQLLEAMHFLAEDRERAQKIGEKAKESVEGLKTENIMDIWRKYIENK